MKVQRNAFWGRCLWALGLTLLFSQLLSAALAPRITGEIKARKAIDGAEYAVISVGSEDGVTKGMKLKVVDKEGKLICHLIIDTPEKNNSVGHLEGRNLDKVERGTKVEG